MKFCFQSFALVLIQTGAPPCGELFTLTIDKLLSNRAFFITISLIKLKTLITKFLCVFVIIILIQRN